MDNARDFLLVFVGVFGQICDKSSQGAWRAKGCLNRSESLSSDLLITLDSDISCLAHFKTFRKQNYYRGGKLKEKPHMNFTLVSLTVLTQQKFSVTSALISSLKANRLFLAKTLTVLLEVVLSL